MAIHFLAHVWKFSPFTGSSLLVHLALADFANDEGLCFPSIATIAKKARISDRQAQRVIATMKQKGLISMDRRFNNSNLYQLHNCCKTPGDKMSPGDTRVATPVTPMSPPPVTPDGVLTVNKNRHLTSAASAADPRHASIRTYIQNMYLQTVRVKCPWNGVEAKMLARLLADSPSWTAEMICAWVANRFASDVARGDRPSKWLMNISKYAQGPLDRFGKPKQIAPSVTKVGAASNGLEDIERRRALKRAKGA